MFLARSGRSGRTIAALAFLALGSSRSDAAAINYASMNDEQVSSFDSGGVTVTGSGPLAVDYHGVNVLGGIVGPYSNGTTDPSESLTFKFDAGPATGVTLGSQGMGYSNFPASQDGEIFLTAFDASGRPIGTMALLPVLAPGSFQYAISAAFGDVPIASFLLRPAGDAASYTFIQPTSLNFTPSIPEPSTLAVFALAAIPALRRLASGRRP